VNDPATVVPDQYILIFREDISDDDRVAHMKKLQSGFSNDIGFNNVILHTYTIGDYKGFAAKLSPAMLAIEKASSMIQLIEQDQYMYSSQTCQTQNGATWGIDRIAERDLSLDGIYRYGVTASGVDAYIVDTGINIKHKEFGTRAIWGANFVDNQNTDCNGHGTHVAGTVGAATYGVAKQVTLIAVKVLGCDGSGTNAGVIAGINWVSSSFGTRKRPSVANMSLGGGKSTATDNAVAAVVKVGVTFVVAAGNDNKDACNYSPAACATAVTVGATGTDDSVRTEVDNRAYFSNYGTCVSLFAPGLEITSTWIGSKNTEIMTISGTSMASPHVCGVAALYMGAHPTATPATVKAWLLSNGSDGIIDLDCTVTACSKSPNVFLFSPCNP